jgi:hypothetical protein
MNDNRTTLGGNSLSAFTFGEDACIEKGAGIRPFKLGQRFYKGDVQPVGYTNSR